MIRLSLAALPLALVLATSSAVGQQKPAETKSAEPTTAQVEAYRTAYRTQDPRLFIPHSWVEIEIDGSWVPVDPTFGQVPADVFRIRCRPLQPGDLIPDPSGVLTVDLKR